MRALQNNAESATTSTTKREKQVLILTLVGDAKVTVRCDDFVLQDSVNAQP